MTTEQVLNHARILIVDDEPANLKLLDKMLASQG
jgi:CheY-like chemotaxis protein